MSDDASSAPAWRCPACDAEEFNLTQLEALALGVAMGSAFHMHGITEMMCDRHRAAYIIAGMKMTMKINSNSRALRPCSHGTQDGDCASCDPVCSQALNGEHSADDTVNAHCANCGAWMPETRAR